MNMVIMKDVNVGVMADAHAGVDADVDFEDGEEDEDRADRRYRTDTGGMAAHHPPQLIPVRRLRGGVRP